MRTCALPVPVLHRRFPGEHTLVTTLRRTRFFELGLRQGWRYEHDNLDLAQEARCDLGRDILRVFNAFGECASKASCDIACSAWAEVAWSCQRWRARRGRGTDDGVPHEKACQ